MKNFFNAFYDLAISIGRARAATHLARHGRYAEAKALMLAK